ncbi:MAG: F-box protein [Chlamydiales bacterium]|nr:F-box protein [Chlamydiales bacterium]
MSSLGSISASANASYEENLANPFSSLSDEVIAEIFNRCTLPEIVMLMRVCRRFFLIGKILPVWRRLFERAWMGPYPIRLDSQRGAVISISVNYSF